jgi:hypothetical protein
LTFSCSPGSGGRAKESEQIEFTNMEEVDMNFNLGINEFAKAGRGDF